MSLPQFTVKLLAASAQTTTSNIIRTINNIQTQLQSRFASTDKKVQNDSILLQNITLNNGSNQVQHTLGRTLTGWKLTRLRGFAVIYDQQDQQSNPGQYLTLVASQAVVVDILVF